VLGKRVLVIDDEPAILEICQATLEQNGHRVHTCPTGKEGLATFPEDDFDLVLIDLRMHDIDGLTLLGKIQAVDRGIVAVMITGEPTIESAVAAVKQGAFDYLPKPFSPDQLMIVVSRGLNQKHLLDENELLRRSLKLRPEFEGVVGTSRAMDRMMTLVGKVAESDSSVVVIGETGTGKELVSRCLHANSSRRDALFLPINCGALPEHLLESELFGHEKGAFTGAMTQKPGLLETAQGGTVFLDEISALSPNLQVKLLRVLQERLFRRVGGHREIAIDVRFISATNEELEDLIAKGTFRSDLYYRLNVISIPVPPLRDRLEDIPLLARYFLDQLNAKGDKRVASVSREAIDIMQGFGWPGNVRELQNVVERAFWLTDSDSIVPQDLPVRISEGVQPAIDASLPYGEAKKIYLEPFERGYLSRLLEENGGNVSRAAEQAGLHRSSFQRLLKQHSIRSVDHRP
jgi:DNA-binding NtrC family response regulator